MMNNSKKKQAQKQYSLSSKNLETNQIFFYKRLFMKVEKQEKKSLFDDENLRQK